ncbi:DUF4333 domain-containing protein [Conexibacter sp. SYSU D00693]|uniref:DUF4333 domain-containing protein n=1 Tax=Conexibacter sp. SYSU D00693 TaxID=2812560 RepID=UPI00196B88B9|nr:DUF4333 domain-containing protein [Conexibacter sp. SYSU D00693]
MTPARWALLALFAVGLALVFGLASRERRLDADDAAAKVATYVQDQLGVRLQDVSCPDDVAAEQGRRFTCTARAMGRRLELELELTDDQGRFKPVRIDGGPRPGGTTTPRTTTTQAG